MNIAIILAGGVGKPPRAYYPEAIYEDCWQNGFRAYGGGLSEAYAD